MIAGSALMIAGTAPMIAGTALVIAGTARMPHIRKMEMERKKQR
jgi:hypothetical protein